MAMNEVERKQLVKWSELHVLSLNKRFFFAALAHVFAQNMFIFVEMYSNEN